MTIIENPGRPEVQAVFLKSHLNMMKAGMRNSRITPTQMLAKASAITGIAYKRGQYEKAVNDLQAIIDASRKT